MSEKNNVRPFGFKDKIGYMFGDFGNVLHSSCLQALC